jgi:hypothetical protein
MLTTDVKKVYAFMTGSRNCTAREIAGGSGLPLFEVQLILDAVVASGEIKQTGVLNTATYNIVGLPEPVVQPAKPYVTRDMLDNAEARAREKAKQDAAMPPAPPLRRDLNDAQLDEIIAAENARKLTITLTPEEQAEADLMHKNRRGIRNPNAFVK